MTQAKAPKGEGVAQAKEYPKPALTADIVVFALDEVLALRALFIKRKHAPFEGAWALPGGFCEPTEAVAVAAARELHEETGLTGLHLEELASFTKPGRDPRGWTVTVAHLALVPSQTRAAIQAGDDASEAAWLRVLVDRGAGYRLERDVDGARVTAGTLAFDHHDILACALARLQERAEVLAFELLPAQFTLGDARMAFEVIFGERLDPDVFATRIVADGIVAPAPPREGGTGGEVRYVRSGKAPRRSWLLAREEL